MKIGIGNDHAGIDLKRKIEKHLIDKGYEVINYGINEDEKIDYPLISKKVCEGVISGYCDFGIVICGTGIGVSIVANKINGIRAAVCTDTYQAIYSRKHNNANVICLGARVIGDEVAKMLVDEFLTNEFEGGRHQRRVDLIKEIEDSQK